MSAWESSIECGLPHFHWLNFPPFFLYVWISIEFVYMCYHGSNNRNAFNFKADGFHLVSRIHFYFAQTNQNQKKSEVFDEIEMCVIRVDPPKVYAHFVLACGFGRENQKLESFRQKRENTDLNLRGENEDFQEEHTKSAWTLKESKNRTIWLRCMLYVSKWRNLKSIKYLFWSILKGRLTFWPLFAENIVFFNEIKVIRCWDRSNTVKLVENKKNIQNVKKLALQNSWQNVHYSISTP